MSAGAAPGNRSRIGVQQVRSRIDGRVDGEARRIPFAISIELRGVVKFKPFL
jgi:hypothetical protein